MDKSGLRYEALPERICFALRGAHDGFGGVQRDEANYCLNVKTDRGVELVSFDEAHDYIAAWRLSGLWSLHGAEDTIPATTGATDER